ncbi:MAG: formylglycine-generating enzyme family protein [Verrucomicrobia bacterium]|jgi:formylglycine-generating enzyme required for sulfatase activity|nr:formylglycine-generating enzyme family protein [Verrucomicrobiota bacterium]
MKKLSALRTGLASVVRYLQLVALASVLVPCSRADETRFFRIAGPVPTTITDVTADGNVTWTNEATNATFTAQTATTLAGESNWVDWVQVLASNAVTVHRIFDPNPPSGMAFIPAGSFAMGATTNMGHESYSDEVPQHSVYVSAFYMDRYEVTNDKMVEVMQWAYQQGKISVTSATVRNLEGNQRELLDLDSSDCRITWNGSQFQMKAAKGAGYPCVTVTWYGAVAFCNYHSQREGRTACYNLSDWSCNWLANGYRLPTEAEWEKAARGGSSGHRFPWSDTDNITHSRANYYSSSSYAYDTSPTRGYHTNFNTGGVPYTNPVDFFSANGYGLHDMAGNVFEWCWDWYDGSWYSNAGATQNNTRGPTGPLSRRVLRGGDWFIDADYARCANRVSFYPGDDVLDFGFRCVRGL